MYKALEARMSPEVKMMEVRKVRDWPEVRCCAQEDDRGQAEVMKVMVMKSVVTDMREMEQNKREKPGPKAKPGNLSLSPSEDQCGSPMWLDPPPNHSTLQIIIPAGMMVGEFLSLGVLPGRNSRCPEQHPQPRKQILFTDTHMEF